MAEHAKWQLWTGESIDARTTLARRVVSEVAPHERGLEIARGLAAKQALCLSLQKQTLNRNPRKRLVHDSPFGMALEGLTAADRSYRVCPSGSAWRGEMACSSGGSPVMGRSIPVGQAQWSRARAPVAGCDPTTSGQSTVIEVVCQPDAPSGAGGALVSVWTCPSESLARTARLW